MKLTTDIRHTFVDYFIKQGHTPVTSSSLIPHDDPTLLFTNAGMNQFKNYFLGLESRDYVRAVSHQKCVRAGGKHNDLDNVGFTARHHTFFEMLGNFSFGNYFKKEAIHFAWELLTKVFQIPKEKLYVTVYKSDDEAAEIWHKQIGLSLDRIFRLGEKDNFWRMGDVGPCGPSSEIFYDHGPSCGSISDPYQSILAGEDRYIEIWNLVFMQYDEVSPGQLKPLPSPSVDTGAGLERLTAAIFGEPNNYNTPLFLPLIEKGAKLTQVDLSLLLKNEKNKTLDSKSFQTLSALRVLADHARSTSFLLADHALPSNEGRGYVLRRIIRRALRYGHKLSPGTSLLPEISNLVIDLMKGVYPELEKNKKIILETLKDEETRFFTTLDQGNHLLKNEFQNLRTNNKKQISGETAFKLYDTFGFPLDLTQLIAQEEGFSVDTSGFESAMNKAKELAKATWKKSSLSESDLTLSKLSQDIKSQQGATQFLGYETIESPSKLLQIMPINNTTSIAVFDRSPFYASGGGQINDSGFLLDSKNKEICPILEIQKKNEILFHFIPSEVKLIPGEVYTLKVQQTKRNLIKKNHSATHLLHAALRKVLGDHVVQAGSLVEDSRLRFDFTHPKAVTKTQLEDIEALVNEQIANSLPVTTQILEYEEAIKKGAMAFFQDKYTDKVRVLTMGNFSMELCGGTHVNNTSEIGLFLIVSESSVSSGVRRIEALTSHTAFQFLKRHMIENNLTLNALNKSVSWDYFLNPSSNPLATEQIEKLKSTLKDFEKKSSLNTKNEFNLESFKKNLVSIKYKEKEFFVGFVLDENLTRDDLMAINDQIKSISLPLIYFLCQPSSEPGKASVSLIGLTPSDQKFNAGLLFKSLSEKWGGKGGGRSDLAQGTLLLPSNDKSKIKEAFLKFLS